MIGDSAILIGEARQGKEKIQTIHHLALPVLQYGVLLLPNLVMDAVRSTVYCVECPAVVADGNKHG